MSQPPSESTTANAPSTKIYYQVFGALMVLLALMVGASLVNLGAFNELIALVIAGGERDGDCLASGQYRRPTFGVGYAASADHSGGMGHPFGSLGWQGKRH